MKMLNNTVGLWVAPVSVVILIFYVNSRMIPRTFNVISDTCWVEISFYYRRLGRDGILAYKLLDCTGKDLLARHVDALDPSILCVHVENRAPC